MLQIRFSNRLPLRYTNLTAIVPLYCVCTQTLVLPSSWQPTRVGAPATSSQIAGDYLPLISINCARLVAGGRLAHPIGSKVRTAVVHRRKTPGCRSCRLRRRWFAPNESRRALHSDADHLRAVATASCASAPPVRAAKRAPGSAVRVRLWVIPHWTSRLILQNPSQVITQVRVRLRPSHTFSPTFLLHRLQLFSFSCIPSLPRARRVPSMRLHAPRDNIHRRVLPHVRDALFSSENGSADNSVLELKLPTPGEQVLRLPHLDLSIRREQ